VSNCVGEKWRDWVGYKDVYVVVVVSLSKAMSHVLVKEASWEIMITLGLID
jgi:hypothetical protein